VTNVDARHRRELPTIIAGDFNADPDATGIRYPSARQAPLPDPIRKPRVRASDP
jgi:endonuclease/exonuclease/phosphatase family metal-dependent hydrolase